VTGAELLRRLRRLAREKSLPFDYEARHGKGSHGRVFLGDRLTTLKDPKKEIGPGLLSDMLRQLGITKDDLP
jgi:mRNA interferase HicA